MKNVLITGVGRGLGKALFDLFISRSYHVSGVIRNESAAEILRQDLPENASLITADLSQDSSVDSIREVIQDRPIDLLINNAGISGKSFRLEEVESAEVVNLLNIHCLGVLRTVRSVKDNLVMAKHPVVINLNSRLGSINRQGNGTYDSLNISYSYRIAKAAQNMLTVCLRKEFGEIEFISLHPGKMKTEIASKDADLEPSAVALQILESYESNNLREENGIIELGKDLIEWWHYRKSIVVVNCTSCDTGWNWSLKKESKISVSESLDL